MASILCKQVCPHCDSLLSKKAFEAHRRLYYDSGSQQWIKKRCLQQPEVCAFDEPSEEEHAFDPNPGNRTDSTVLEPPLEPPPPIVEFDATLEGNLGKESII